MKVGRIRDYCGNPEKWEEWKDGIGKVEAGRRLARITGSCLAHCDVYKVSLVPTSLQCLFLGTCIFSFRKVLSKCVFLRPRMLTRSSILRNFLHSFLSRLCWSYKKGRSCYSLQYLVGTYLYVDINNYEGSTKVSMELCGETFTLLIFVGLVRVRRLVRFYLTCIGSSDATEVS